MIYFYPEMTPVLTRRGRGHVLNLNPTAGLAGCALQCNNLSVIKFESLSSCDPNNNTANLERH